MTIDIMINKKNLFGRIVLSVVAVLALVSCESTYVDIYIKNSTSQTIVFKGEGEYWSGYDWSFHTIKDSINLKSGEKALVFQYEDYYGFSRVYDMAGLMMCAYPKQIIIRFEDGETFTYSPDSLETQFNSPYDYNSFFYHEMDNDKEATYMVLY